MGKNLSNLLIFVSFWSEKNNPRNFFVLLINAIEIDIFGISYLVLIPFFIRRKLFFIPFGL